MKIGALFSCKRSLMFFSWWFGWSYHSMPLKIRSLGNKVIDVLWNNSVLAIVHPMHPVGVAPMRSWNISQVKKKCLNINFHEHHHQKNCGHNCRHNHRRCVSFYGFMVLLQVIIYWDWTAIGNICQLRKTFFVNGGLTETRSQVMSLLRSKLNIKLCFTFVNFWSFYFHCLSHSAMTMWKLTLWPWQSWQSLTVWFCRASCHLVTMADAVSSTLFSRRCLSEKMDEKPHV